MPDQRTVDELSLHELEELLQQRRRIERARRTAHNGERRRVRAETVSPTQQLGTPTDDGTASRGTRDRALLFVEISAGVALVLVVIGFLTNLDAINQAAGQTLAGAPSLAGRSGSAELPASPFPPADSLTELPGSSFPPEPAPPGLGLRLQAVAAIPVPTVGPRAPTRIVIPGIKLDWPVVEGDGWEELKQGIGHRVGTANPGERGNMILSGHNDVYGEPFRDLEIIEVGKEVVVYSGSNAFRYVIKSKRVVAPTDLSPLEPSRTPIVTMITCTPYRVDTMRLIVVGELVP